MASLRVLKPLARPGTWASSRVPRLPPTTINFSRLLNTESAPVLYSAHAKVVGARTGHVDGDDLKVDLTMAKALGGAGDKGKTNPEELFAAGYGACFQSAMNAAAASMKIQMPSRKEDSVVETTVHLVGDMKKLDMGLRVQMKVRVKGLSGDDLQKVVDKAKEVCPYSRATKGNVSTEIEVVNESEAGGSSGSSEVGGSSGSVSKDKKPGSSNGEAKAYAPDEDVGNPDMPSKGSSTYG